MLPNCGALGIKYTRISAKLEIALALRSTQHLTRIKDENSNLTPGGKDHENVKHKQVRIESQGKNK